MRKVFLRTSPGQGLKQLLHACALMTTTEKLQIKGWRSRIEEEAVELRQSVSSAPSRTVYHAGQDSPGSNNLLGHSPWFHREFGVERAIASAALKKHRAVRIRIARSEWSDEQREAANAYSRAWRAKQSAEWRKIEASKKRTRRAAKPELYRAIDRRHEERRRDRRNAKRRAVYTQSPGPHRARAKARRAARTAARMSSSYSPAGGSK